MMIRETIGPVAAFRTALEVKRLPKTRSRNESTTTTSKNLDTKLNSGRRDEKKAQARILACASFSAWMLLFVCRPTC